MSPEDKTGLLDEISRMESELRVKKQRLATAGVAPMPKPAFDDGCHPGKEDLERIFEDLIRRIGAASRGGSSVDDIRKNRASCDPLAHSRNGVAP